MSMCLVQHLTAGFTVRNIATWLSEHSGFGPWMGNPISLLMDLSHVACHPVLASYIYSASSTESATILWCCNAQEIAPFAIRKMCPDVEWLSSVFSPQSESEYPINPASELLPYLISSSFVHWRYLSTYFVYLICCSIGLLLNCDNCVAQMLCQV